MKKNARGFTLLELTTVVAIVGILAAVSIPGYSDYLKRAQVAESLGLSNKFRWMIAEYYAHTGRLPKNNLALGISESAESAGKFVQNLVVEDGAIHIYFKDKSKFGTLTLLPSILDINPPNNIINWTCGYARPVANMKLIGENKTDINRAYLPRSCL